MKLNCKRNWKMNIDVINSVCKIVYKFVKKTTRNLCEQC